MEPEPHPETIHLGTSHLRRLGTYPSYYITQRSALAAHLTTSLSGSLFIHRPIAPLLGANMHIRSGRDCALGVLRHAVRFLLLAQRGRLPPLDQLHAQRGAQDVVFCAWVGCSCV